MTLLSAGPAARASLKWGIRGNEGKREGAVSRALGASPTRRCLADAVGPSSTLIRRLLRLHCATGAGDVRPVAVVVGRDAVLLANRGAGRRVGGGAGLDRHDARNLRRTGGEDLHAVVVVGLQATGARERDARVRVVVGEVRLRIRNGLADVRSGRSLLRALLEPEVRRDRNREQHTDNDQDDEELDQRETALVPDVQALSEGMHAVLL